MEEPTIGMTLDLRPSALWSDSYCWKISLKWLLVMIFCPPPPAVNMRTKLCLSAYACNPKAVIIINMPYILKHFLLKVLYLLMHSRHHHSANWCSIVDQCRLTRIFLLVNHCRQGVKHEEEEMIHELFELWHCKKPDSLAIVKIEDLVSFVSWPVIS